MNIRKKRRTVLERKAKTVKDLLFLWLNFPNATNYRGLNYAGPFARTNKDDDTGIRYGIIHQKEIGERWYEVEMDYGPARCPQCGNEAVAGDSPIPLDELLELIDQDRNDLTYKTLHHACGDYACDSCRLLFDGEDAFGDEGTPYVDDGYYKASSDSNGDIWIFKSPYFTRAQFCSPCAPGACYLNKPCPTGDRAYCFGHEWFEDNKAPYPIWSVATGKLVKSK